VAASLAYLAGNDGGSPASAFRSGGAGQDGFSVLAETAPTAGAPNLFEKAPSLVVSRDVDVASARQARVRGRNVWVATGRDVICVLAQADGDDASFGGGCADLDTVRAQGLFTGSHPSPQAARAQGLSKDATEVLALLPDGVTSVAVTLGDGAKVDIPVVDNIALARFADATRSARFVDADGQAHVNNLTSDVVSGTVEVHR
jgi:hypothetical protein